MHSWNLTEAEALDLQVNLAKKITLAPLADNIDYIAGVDVAYSKKQNIVVGAVVVLDAKTHCVINTCTAVQTVDFPYIPGLFSFRELPPVLKAFNDLPIKPHLIVCDGHGIAHPRRFGLASHLGLITDTPCIGCAKNSLLKSTQNPGIDRGQTTDIVLNNEIVGNVLRTQQSVKPVFVSPGYKITLKESVDWILQLSPEYRLPETTRIADQTVNAMLKTLGD